MKKWVFVLMTVFIALGTTVQSQETAPLKLVQTITLPPDVKGHFDHFEVDVKGNRLFHGSGTESLLRGGSLVFEVH